MKKIKEQVRLYKKKGENAEGNERTKKYETKKRKIKIRSFKKRKKTDFFKQEG